MPDQKFKDRLRKRGFIGQELAVNKLSILAEEIMLGGRLNILFIGEAGYGKTTLAKELLEYINPEGDLSKIYIPDQNGGYLLKGDKLYHFLDEVHEFKYFEMLYHLMEEEKFCLFFASNYYDRLPEPFIDRCEKIILARYENYELAEIILNVFKKHKINIEFSFCYLIAEYTRGVPRICRNTGKRLSFAFKQYGVPSSEEDLHEFMYTFYGLQKGGYTQQDILYLDYLKNVGGQSSLQRIISGTGLPRKTVETYIEPFLLKKKRIQITYRGRLLIND